MSINPRQLSIYSAQVADLYAAVEDEIFMKIAERLATDSDKSKDYVLQWQAEKLKELGALNSDTIKALSTASGIASDMIEDIFKDIGVGTVESIDNQVKRAGIANALAPTDFDTLTTAYVNQTFIELDNMINETLITTNFAEGTVTKMYRNIINTTTGIVLAGSDTIQQAVTKIVIDAQKKGINTGFVDRGGNTWQLERYAQMVVRTNTNRAYRQITLDRMDDHGLEFMLMSSKPAARPQCAKIQGRVVSMHPVTSNTEYPSVYDYGYGEPDGVAGINCAHQFYVFIPGVNENNQIQYDESEVDKKYEQQQEQRYLERRIRESKRALRTAEIMGSDEQIDKYKKQVANRQLKMREYISSTGLTRNYGNERVL